MSERRTSDVGRLIRLGLHDPDRARRLCESERVAPLLQDLLGVVPAAAHAPMTFETYRAGQSLSARMTAR